MKVLLINPNDLLRPPVPPIGLEYVAAAVRSQGHDVQVLDLCFSDDPFDDLSGAVTRFQPQAAGLTVRNIDSVLFSGNEFYLDRIREMVAILRDRFRVPVFSGGAALRADPEGVVSYLGADCGVVGPSSGAVVDCLRWMQDHPGGKRIFPSVLHQFSTCGRDIDCIDYPRYLRNSGVAGFLTHSGCSSSCVYCIEANSPVSFREPDEVIAEIRRFIEKGIDTFHLCDSEFNEDLEYSLAFLDLLIRSGLRIRWSLYLKPAEHNRKLFRLMAAAGVTLITLSVDSFNKCPVYWTDTEKIIFSARAEGIRIAVDFITGFPYEDADSLSWSLDFFRRLQPDTVNVNTYLRLYRTLKITDIIAVDPSLHKDLIGWSDRENLVRPVFYNRIPQETVRNMIQGDGLFRIDVSGEGVNYTRFG